MQPCHAAIHGPNLCHPPAGSSSASSIRPLCCTVSLQQTVTTVLHCCCILCLYQDMKTIQQWWKKMKLLLFIYWNSVCITSLVWPLCQSWAALAITLYFWDYADMNVWMHGSYIIEEEKCRLPCLRNGHKLSLQMFLHIKTSAWMQAF